jgi:hypothetical protein
LERDDSSKSLDVLFVLAFSMYIGFIGTHFLSLRTLSPPFNKLGSNLVVLSVALPCSLGEGVETWASQLAVVKEEDNN